MTEMAAESRLSELIQVQRKDVLSDFNFYTTETIIISKYFFYVPNNLILELRSIYWLVPICSEKIEEAKTNLIYIVIPLGVLRK